MSLSAAFQAEGGCESLKRETKLFSEGANVHEQEFAHGKHFRKPVVRQRLNDGRLLVSHNANMARQRKGRHELYDQYRAASGWYLAAWRDFRKLTLEELAEEIGSSKGYVSDLETGAARPDRPIRRFNRDLVESVSKALSVTGGRLIDVNPFTMDADADQFDAALKALDPMQRQAVFQLAQTLGGKTGTDG